MSKKLQVVLSKSVSKLGKDGDMVEVAPGYATNYLIPQGFAKLATPGIIKQVEQRKAKEQQRIIAEREDALARKTALQTVGRFVVRKQVGEGESIFGTVTTQDLADAIKASTGQEVDRRGITIPEIGKTGFYKAQVKIHPEVTAEVEIQVAPL
ncbi:50S ribosomal protein L9 [Aphanothece hegewaldii CCALA 016]|uniref:Large ribosomal subunit protein bL9 n=1 Tax=Aphanothece hegewaldii CCALA 016 TaxID=2107694 RepID=A0A2T1LY49_9CHRO|nr:50S ribosomal protein L9 [Aphanothece hegewaldii]PSF37318.1 50S ribosomal protein L9 [Aphanothece hegewaldii CCALA 016]